MNKEQVLKMVADAYNNGHHDGFFKTNGNDTREAYLSSLVFEDGWISCKEKMPEHLIGVLVFIPDEDFHITSGMFDISGKWVLLDEYREPECEVTHWMPMPKIPKEYQPQQEEHGKILNWLKGVIPLKK